MVPTTKEPNHVTAGFVSLHRMQVFTFAYIETVGKAKPGFPSFIANTWRRLGGHKIRSFDTLIKTEHVLCSLRVGNLF